MRVIKLEGYRQPSGVEITLRKVRMSWAVLTDLCVERLVDEQVQEGWYGHGEDTLLRIYNEWVRFEQRINSTPL